MSVCTYFAILFVLYFFAYPATTDIYTLSLHDALPILQPVADKRRRIKRSDSPCTEKTPATGKPRSTQARPGEYRSEEHTSELQSRGHLVCRLLLEKKKKKISRKQLCRHNI